MNKIPHDQEVALVAHILDHLDLKRQTALVFGKTVSQQALFRQALQVRNACRKSFTYHHLEITPGVCPSGTLNSGNGLGMRSIFTLQRAAMSTVRLNASGNSRNTCAISVAVLK